MYAVIETGGRQYRVELGSEIELDQLEAEPGSTIELGRVLLVADGDGTHVGRPVVDDAHVTADVIGHARGEKIVVFKYRPKARRRVKHGHRSDLTVVRVADIVIGDRSAARDAQAQSQQEAASRAAAEKEAQRKAAADQALAEKLAAAEAEGAEPAEAPAKPAKGGRRASTKAEAKEPKQGARSGDEAGTKAGAKTAAAAKNTTKPKKAAGARTGAGGKGKTKGGATSGAGKDE